MSGEFVNDLDMSNASATLWVEAAVQTFNESLRLSSLIPNNPNFRKQGIRGNVIQWTNPQGLTTPVTSAITEGDAISLTTPTLGTATATIASYGKRTNVAASMEVMAPFDIISSYLSDLAVGAAQSWDYLCASAIISGCASGNKLYSSADHSSEATLDTDDTMTLSYARQAYRELQNNKAPKFMTPFGELYIAVVHPDVAYDLKVESSGIFTGAQNVNSPEYKFNILGIAGGFLWIETANDALYNADGGAGVVDSYRTLFVANNSIGYAWAPVALQPGTTDFPIMPDRSVIARLTYPQTYLGLAKEIGWAGNFAFGVVQQNGVIVCYSAATGGANAT